MMQQRNMNPNRMNSHKNSVKYGRVKQMAEFMIWAGRIAAFGSAVCILAGFGSLYLKSAQAEERTMTGGQIQILEGTVLTETETGNNTVHEESAGTTTANLTEETPGNGNPQAEWPLILVNPWHSIPEGYSDTIVLTELINGQSIDQRCYPDLQAMMDDCRAAGYSPYICSSYRSQEKQTRLFEHNVAALMQTGYSEEEARAETAKNVAKPGTSEHQLGLAVDIVDKNYQVLDEAQEDTEVQKWLMENSWRYGFILRYPTDRSDVTGIVYEPWHYRYVGKEAAEEIYRNGIVLEEYLEEQE